MTTRHPEETGLRARARRLAAEAVDVVSHRARAVLRRQLTAARSSDSVLRRRAYLVTRQVARRGVNAVSDRQLGWVATLWGARWLDGTRYAVDGWAYERGYGYADPPQVRVYLTRPGSARTVEAEVRGVEEMEVNAFAGRAEFDYANTAFHAELDLAPLLDDESPDRPWQVRLEVRGSDGRVRTGTLKYRHRHSSARVLGARTLGGVQLVPSWRARRGLFFSRHTPAALATEVEVAGRDLRVHVRLDGVDPARAELESAHAVRPLELGQGADGSVTLSARIPPTWVLESADQADVGPELEDGALDRGATEEDRDVEEFAEAAAGSGDDADPAHAGQVLRPQTYRLVLVDHEGERHPVATSLDQQIADHGTGAGLLAFSGASGLLYVSEADAHLLVADVQLVSDEPPVLQLQGRWTGAVDALQLSLVGRRQTLPLAARTLPDGTWTATVELLQSQWGGPRQLPRTGSYTLRASGSAGSARVLAAPDVVARTPEKLAVPRSRVRLEVDRARAVRLRIGVTRRPDELGSFHQRRMDAAYLAATHQPEDAVYFESFYGRAATCNPFAIDRVVAREHPQLRRYWGVTDLSVAVPEGAVAVVEGTQAWFDARARSRYVVANDWLRRRFVPQPFQTVLQTWHGSMFKRIGLDRPKVPRSTRLALETERDKWDLLLSQNPHSTEILRSAYAWDREILQEGYPRNDTLAHGDGDQVRRLLGIRQDQRVLLYAPTWRDNSQGMVVFLDLERLADELGDEYVVLVRGHTRTLGHGASLEHRGVVDVSTYPHIADLFLAADAMITDYSSVMFDYSVTRRPMIFFVPDLAAYSDEIRGVYFDLADEAPGPVVTTQQEVVAAVRALDDTQPYADRYARWVAKYNPLDDGRSAERVVRRVIGEPR